MALATAPSVSKAAGGADEAFGIPLGAPERFSPNMVTAKARELASRPYATPQRVNAAWMDISYDDYVSLWFDGRNAVWSGEDETPQRIDFFSPGLYFPDPIDFSVGGAVEPHSRARPAPRRPDLQRRGGRAP